MSAWIVSRAHIDALVTAGLAHRDALNWADRRFQLSHSTADRVGQMLWEENHGSVNYRYNSHESCPRYTFRASPVVDPVVLLKQIACYEYQTCERNDWPASEAHAFCAALQSVLVSSLPGWEAAPWGIRDDEPEHVPVLHGQCPVCGHYGEDCTAHRAAREADADHRIKYRIENPEEVDFT